MIKFLVFSDLHYDEVEDGNGDAYSCVDGVSYVTVNSANYAWLGSQIASSEELQEKYAYLQGMLQYKQAMSAYIEIDDEEIRICGW